MIINRSLKSTDSLLNQVKAAQVDFIKHMLMQPNRVMMTQDDAEKLLLEVRPLTIYRGDYELSVEQRTFIMGMRLVVDPWAVGVEAGFVR